MGFLSRFFSEQKPAVRVRREDAVTHLAAKFDFPEENMTASFENKKGWRAGKEEYADILTIHIKQPEGRPNLHQDMHDELRQVFTAQYGAGAFNPKAMKFYFGVSEDKDHRAELSAKRPKRETALPMPGNDDLT